MRKRRGDDLLVRVLVIGNGLPSRVVPVLDGLHALRGPADLPEGPVSTLIYLGDGGAGTRAARWATAAGIPSLCLPLIRPCETAAELLACINARNAKTFAAGVDLLLVFEEKGLAVTEQSLVDLANRFAVRAFFAKPLDPTAPTAPKETL